MRFQKWARQGNYNLVAQRAAKRLLVVCLISLGHFPLIRSSVVGYLSFFQHELSNLHGSFEPAGSGDHAEVGFNFVALWQPNYKLVSSFLIGSVLNLVQFMAAGKRLAFFQWVRMEVGLTSYEYRRQWLVLSIPGQGQQLRTDL